MSMEKTIRMYQAVTELSEETLWETLEYQFPKKPVRWKSWGAAVACLCMVAVGVLFFGLDWAENSPAASLPTETGEAVESEPVSTGDGASTENETVMQSGLLPEYTYSDLLSQSDFIVTATLRECSDCFQIQSADGSVSNFKDYYFTVDKVLLGEGEEGSEISVRIQGGLCGGVNLIVEDAPQVSVGTEVLLFLDRSDVGGWYNTEGDYYYILGLNQGIYYRQDTAALDTDEVVYADCYGNELNLNQVEADAAQMPLASFDYEDDLQRQRDAITQSYENGVITKEGYDDLMAQVGKEEYAVMLTEDPDVEH